MPETLATLRVPLPDFLACSNLDVKDTHQPTALQPYVINILGNPTGNEILQQMSKFSRGIGRSLSGKNQVILALQSRSA